jgi:hypothetical protein
LLAKTRVELVDTAKERDSQMNALAKLISQGGATSADLSAAKIEVLELTERNAKLRKMNEEVMEMLEKVYEEQVCS